MIILFLGIFSVLQFLVFNACTHTHIECAKFKLSRDENRVKSVHLINP